MFQCLGRLDRDQWPTEPDTGAVASASCEKEMCAALVGVFGVGGPKSI